MPTPRSARDAVRTEGEPSDLDARPGDRIAEALARYGPAAVLATCDRLLDNPPGREPQILDLPVSLVVLGGRHAVALLHQGDLAARNQDHWPRVWALRTLRYVGSDDMSPATVRALADPAWRVREMAALVVAVREVGVAGDAVVALANDETARVRRAALRAVGAVGEAEHAVAVRAALGDQEADVVAEAERALRRLADRLDRVV